MKKLTQQLALAAVVLALVRNAIKRVASPGALAWAKANPTHIFT